MISAYIGLGSNLENPAEHIFKALQDIMHICNTQLESVSHTYRSIAVGPGEQPDYVNAACKIKTSLQPLELLDAIQSIENNHGRVRDIRWGARTLDLDLLLYGNLNINNERLIVPHPRANERDFVLRPLLDIDAGLLFPDGTIAQQLLDNAAENGLQVLTTKTSLWDALQTGNKE
jgi:2-amino-4-hydroxy-6-hydroxymethyldihydropteridine diphosphokinase